MATPLSPVVILRASNFPTLLHLPCRNRFAIIGKSLMTSICSSRSVNVSKGGLCVKRFATPKFRGIDTQMDAIRSPRISDFLILCPLILLPRLHRLRGPGGFGDQDDLGAAELFVLASHWLTNRARILSETLIKRGQAQKPKQSYTSYCPNLGCINVR